MGFDYLEKNNYCMWTFNKEVISKDLMESFFLKFQPCSVRLSVFDFSKVKIIEDDAYSLLIQNLRKAVSYKVALLCSKEILKLMEKAELRHCVVVDRSAAVADKIDASAFESFEKISMSSFEAVFKKHLKASIGSDQSKNSLENCEFSAISYLTVGPFVGGIVLDFSSECLQGIAKKILGVEEKDEAVLSDCACELLNWTLGSAKSYLVEAGFDVIGNGPPKVLTREIDPFSQAGEGVVSATIYNTDLGPCQIRTFAKSK